MNWEAPQTCRLRRDRQPIMNFHVFLHLANCTSKIMAHSYLTGSLYSFNKKTKPPFCWCQKTANNCNKPAPLILYSYTLCSCLIPLLTWLCASCNFHLSVCFCNIFQEIKLMLNKAFDNYHKNKLFFFFLAQHSTILYCTLVFFCSHLCNSNLP